MSGLLIFYYILLLLDSAGVTFLPPCKKVTKEDGIGEALTAKPIGTSFIIFSHFPGFEPPSPMYPFRRKREEWF